MIEQTELSKEDIKPGFREWCICEFMGHLRIIGLVTEQELFGARLLRLDIPGPVGSDAHTEYFSGNSIYRLTPVSEQVARNLIAGGESVRPVTPWELRQLKADLAEQGKIERLGQTLVDAREQAQDTQFEWLMVDASQAVYGALPYKKIASDIDEVLEKEFPTDQREYAHLTSEEYGSDDDSRGADDDDDESVIGGYDD